jgi:uncharacterized protein YndB with AHSA1/START domain
VEAAVIEVHRERRVAARPDEVWAVVATPKRAPEWFAFAERVEVLDGPDGVGQRQRQYGRWGGHSAEVDREIVEYDPPRAYAWEHRAERLDGKPAPRFAASTRFRISLEPSGTGTLVHLHSAQEPASVLKGLVMRAFGTRDVAAQLTRSLDRLTAFFPTD